MTNRGMVPIDWNRLAWAPQRRSVVCGPWTIEALRYRSGWDVCARFADTETRVPPGPNVHADPFHEIGRLLDLVR